MKSKHKCSTLLKIRKSLHLTQEKLGRIMHVGQSAVSEFERKGIRTRSAAERYAAALGCDWKDLLD